MKTLGGSTFIHNGLEFDYNFLETIDCLAELCDQVVVVDAGSNDGTTQVLSDALLTRWPQNKVTIIFCGPEAWANVHGREKLSFFSNLAIDSLEKPNVKEQIATDWNFYLQADEIVHEKSFPYIRQAIEENFDGFMVRRYNLWRDCNSILNVEQNRKPCSTEVFRLAKTKFRCVDDAESIGIDGIVSMDYLDKIEIFHLGFVRKQEVMKAKIHQMQVNVFEMAAHDAKLDRHELFQWDDYFSESDLISLQDAKKTLPKFITEWAKTRP